MALVVYLACLAVALVLWRFDDITTLTTQQYKHSAVKQRNINQCESKTWNVTKC